MTKRVVITGFGMVSPLANSAEETWAKIKAGESGVGSITLFDTSNYAVKIAAEVKNFNPADYMPAKEVRRRDRYQHFAVAAAMQAIEHANFKLETDEQRERAGVFIGSAVGGVSHYYEQAIMLHDSGDPRRVTPFGVPMLMPNGASGMVSIEIGAMGPSYTPTSACATGADCIGTAFDYIRLGKLDYALAGRVKPLSYQSASLLLTASAHVHAATTPHTNPSVPLRVTVTALCSGKEQAFWCWSRLKRHKHAVQPFTVKSLVTPLLLTHSISPHPTPKLKAQSTPCVWHLRMRDFIRRTSTISTHTARRHNSTTPLRRWP